MFLLVNPSVDSEVNSFKMACKIIDKSIQLENSPSKTNNYYDHLLSAYENYAMESANI